MKVLWRDAWIEAPGFEVPESGIPIEVSAAIPLVKVENASGRRQRRPGRKVAVFLLTDGPRSTLRKARTKRDEPRFTGDYRITVVLGQAIGSGRRVVALAPRCRPRPSSWWSTVTWSTKSRTVSPRRPAARGRPAVCPSRRAQPPGRQSFLYSGMTPPAELVTACRTPCRPAMAPPGLVTEVISPAPGRRAAADTVMRCCL